MAKKNVGSKAENSVEADAKNVAETKAEETMAEETILIRLFTSAYSTSRGGFLPKGTELEIKEDDFPLWANVAVEVEE